MSTGRIYARPASEGTATAWRFCLPKDLKSPHRDTYFADKNHCWMTQRRMTNSTTSEGWLRKSNFIEDDDDIIQATI
jgi:hypothetical protein